MNKVLLFLLVLPGLGPASQGDVIETPDGHLEITVIGHASLMFVLGDKVIHVDPVSAQGDYTNLPKADLILVTHEHGDHLDQEAIAQIRTEKTEVVATETCAPGVSDAIVMKNGESKTVAGFEVEAVPAYNMDPSRPFHPKGVGNGYVITLGGKRVYVAGDTENIPEMKDLEGIGIDIRIRK
jgi:L-ascorbate metabolism protein UlaG (beta-lactamase superfamily)